MILKDERRCMNSCISSFMEGMKVMACEMMGLTNRAAEDQDSLPLTGCCRF